MELTQLDLDGCTLFVDEWRGISIRPCCDAHDEAFYFGIGLWDFIVANYQLAVCFFEAGVWELVIPAFIATCTIGVVFYCLGTKAAANKSGKEH